MTRRKERQARRNLALAMAGQRAEEQVTRVGFAPVSRVEAARREVELCATSEALDQHGTIFDYAASKDAFTRWMGNVREMHEHVAVGRRMAVRFEDEMRRIFVTNRISRGAEATWEKVLDGTLRGASIGATNVRWERQRRRIGAATSARLDRLDETLRELGAFLSAETSRTLAETYRATESVKGTLDEMGRRIESLEAQPLPGGPVAGMRGHPEEKRLAGAHMANGQPGMAEQIRALESLAGRLADPQAQLAVAAELIRLQREG